MKSNWLGVTEAGLHAALHGYWITVTGGWECVPWVVPVATRRVRCDAYNCGRLREGNSVTVDSKEFGRR